MMMRGRWHQQGRELDLRDHHPSINEGLALRSSGRKPHSEAEPDFVLLNNLITTVGIPVVPSHEMLRRGGEDAKAITVADKKKHIDKGTARLQQLEAEAAVVAPPEPTPVSQRRSTAPATGHRSRHHSSRVSHHGASRRHTADNAASNAGRHHRDDAGSTSVTAPASVVAPTFEVSRLSLFKSVVQKLQEQGGSPYTAALLRKTTALVTPVIAALPAVAEPERRHHRSGR